MGSRTVIAVIAFVLVLLAVPARVRTQTPDVPQGIASALLQEVRSLRMTLEHVVSVGASGQLALGRLHLQEQRLNTVIDRLRATQDRLLAAQRETVEQQKEYARLETMMKEPGGMKRHEYGLSREDLEEMLKAQRESLALTITDVQRLTAEEAALTSEAATEQNRWFDLHRRLEDLERTLSRKH
jgi:ElaB/YqjD/DUF883 family membrane-anchored ribosome-binding protein